MADYVITTVSEPSTPPSTTTALQALPGINSWCVKGSTRRLRSADGKAGRGQGRGRGNKLVSPPNAPWVLGMECSQFLRVSPGGAQNSLFLLLRRSSWMRVCKWVHKITACSLHRLMSAVWKVWITGTARPLCGNNEAAEQHLSQNVSGLHSGEC